MGRSLGLVGRVLVTLVALTSMALGCDADGEALRDGGQAAHDDADRPTTRWCTMSRDGWLSRCDGRPGDGCEGLGSPDPRASAIAYIQLTLADQPELGGLRFRSGPWTNRPLRDLAEQMATSESDAIISLAAAVERAFPNCTDGHVLGEVVRNEVCSPVGTGEIEGVDGAPCVALDHACGRGYLDETRGCCDINRTVVGGYCTTSVGAGACAGDSTCVVGDPGEASNVHGWTEVLPSHSANPRLADWSSEHDVTIRVAEVWDTAGMNEAEVDTVEDSLLGWATLPVGTRSRVVA